MHIERDIYIPMWDGVRLSADVYHSDSPEPGPVVLMRTPYLKSGAMTSDGLNSTGRPAPWPTGIRPDSNPFGLPYMLGNLSPLMGKWGTPSSSAMCAAPATRKDFTTTTTSKTAPTTATTRSNGLRSSRGVTAMSA